MCQLVRLQVSQISTVLLMAIAFWLIGCSASAPPTESNSSLSADVDLSALPGSTPAVVQPVEQPLTASSSQLSIAEQQSAVRQAVQTEPLLNEGLQQEINRAPDPSRVFSPLEIGAIAIVDNYAIAEWSATVGDLPFDSYALLIQQGGQWIVISNSTGLGPAEINPDFLANLGVPDAVSQALLDALRADGADFLLSDVSVRESQTICLTQIDDRNPPTNVRLMPVVEAENIVGRLPDGTVVTPIEPLNGWLKIRQPVVGWVSLNLTRVSCGNSLEEVQNNLNRLQSLEEEMSINAADTLVRYLYRGAAGPYTEAAIVTFDQFASDRFYAVRAALDAHSEEVRQSVLQQVHRAGLSPQARASFEQAAQIHQDTGFRSPTLETWRTVNQN
jgi:hypothetical protein